MQVCEYVCVCLCLSMHVYTCMHAHVRMCVGVYKYVMGNAANSSAPQMHIKV